MAPFLLGFGVGFALARLLTPYSGAEMRSLLGVPGAPPASEELQRRQTEARQRARETLARMREGLGETVEAARPGGGLGGRLRRAVEAGRQAYVEALAEARARYQRMLREPRGRPRAGT